MTTPDPDYEPISMPGSRPKPRSLQAKDWAALDIEHLVEELEGMRGVTGEPWAIT